MINPLISAQSNPTFISLKPNSSEKGLIATIVEVFDNVIWGFVSNIGKFVRQTFKIAINETPEYAERLDKVIAGVGLLTGISVLLSVKSLPGQMMNLYKNIPLDDLEGGILGSFELLATLGDILDSVGTFANSLSAIDAMPKIVFFSAIGLPLATSLLSYAILSKSYQLFCNGKFVSSLPDEITEKNIEEFKHFIIDRVKDPLKNLKTKKIKILSRHADPKVVCIMQNLLVHLKSNPHDAKTADLALKDIKSLMNRKIIMGVVLTISNIAMLVALVASAVFASFLVVVPFVGAIKACTNIGLLGYKTFFFDSKLNRPEFLQR